MKATMVIEIILLVLVVAVTAFFVWQVNAVQPQSALEVPDAAQTLQTEEPVEQQPEEIPEAVTEPGEIPEAVTEEVPAEELHTKDTWSEVLEDHDLSADTYFIYDLSADRFMVRSDTMDTHLYPASITKLFTAYVALQHASAEEEITVGSEIKLIDVDSSVADLKVGDVLTVEQLVAGMLLPSGNDAAYALSTAIGRKLAEDPDMGAQDAMDRFVEQMNAEAETLGMTESHFVTPDGNHDEDHYIGLADMVTLGKLALENEVIARYASTLKETASAGDTRSLEWKNTNLMINENSDYYSDQTVGLKTGFTTPAGYCVLTAVRMDQRDLLIGVFGSSEKEGRFADALLLLAQNFMLDIYEPVSNAPEEPVYNEAA